MSRVIMNIEAEDCNAWASDLVVGLPSPLSVSLYLRAVFAQHAELGFGECVRFVLGLRRAEYDTGRLSSRPLLTYQSAPAEAKPGPMMDEDRFGRLSVSLLVETSSGSDACAQLERAVTFMPFLGGNVRAASVAAVPAGKELETMRGALVVCDETDVIGNLFGGDMVRALSAVAVANTDPATQQAVAQRFGLTENMFGAVNGRMYVVMPVGYRRLNRFCPRPDARPVRGANGALQQGMHAFVEAAHGFVRLLGPRKAFDGRGRPWWRAHAAASLDDQMVYHVKGEQHGY